MAEAKTDKGGKSAKADKAPAKAAKTEVKAEAKTNAVEDELRKISPDALSPREALELLYQLRAKLPS